MKFKLGIFFVITLLLTVGCTDEREVEYDLLSDCENHFQATSYKVAVEVCTEAAENGITEAQWLLANIYEFDLTGEGADPDNAFNWYLKAAEGGHMRAQTLVGESYLHATGVTQDFEQAFQWLNKAARNGDPNAEFNIGYMYFAGKGRNKDISAALSWYRKAATKDHLMSINNLAWIYATSKKKTIRSAKKAQYWAEKLVISDDNRSVFLDTKAAAYAIAGDFIKAVELQNEAIANLPEEVEESQLLEFQKHLESYQQEKPWEE
ncbi:tetratricopeptide repeat protein [Aliikangiella marina]|nr:tetratricopeptide repeat protein [Aliikangiella marina]